MKTTNIYAYNNEHILLLQRSLSDLDGGMWETAGGHIDWENFVESQNPDRYFDFIKAEAERELFEETGINAHNRSVFSPIQMFPEHCSFLLKLTSDMKCKLSFEHSAYMWTRFDQLPNNTRPQVISFLRHGYGALL